MPVDVYRIDDRLIHGQVVVGWGQALPLGFIVLVDDAVAASQWERDLYRLGTPPDMDLFVETVDSAVARMDEFKTRPDHGMVLTGDVATMDRLSLALPGLTRVNLGGLHHRAGCRQRLAYVFLTGADGERLTAMAARGVVITAQDLPGADEVPLAELLAGGGG
ncbi:MAG TPA: PTS sugar transporter subunit IIB [Gemmatimonadaceae bacterium]|nr:PTS sugar transporter subunit IIB [Gemmatimonadaceae bacterium]